MGSPNKGIGGIWKCFLWEGEGGLTVRPYILYTFKFTTGYQLLTLRWPIRLQKAMENALKRNVVWNSVRSLPLTHTYLKIFAKISLNNRCCLLHTYWQHIISSFNHLHEQRTTKKAKKKSFHLKRYAVCVYKLIKYFNICILRCRYVHSCIIVNEAYFIILCIKACRENDCFVFKIYTWELELIFL